MKLDERTLVPLGPVIGCMAIIFAVVASGAWWMKSVNDRLYVIEEKLGIPHIPSGEPESGEVVKLWRGDR